MPKIDSNDLLNYRLGARPKPLAFAKIEQRRSVVESNTFVNQRVMVFAALLSSLVLWAIIGLGIAAMLGRSPI
jgi:predicted cobalt transporter CbtA